MSKRRSAEDSFEPFFVAGTLASHFNHGRGGFRQRDVRFVIELFWNWMESMGEFATQSIQNVQVSRYLAKLVTQGWLRVGSHRPTPRYHLTRVGNVRLLAQLSEKAYFARMEHFYFVYYFLGGYGGLIDQLIEDDPKGFSPSLQAQLRSSLNASHLLTKQIHFIESEITKIDGRIKEAQSAATLAETLLKGGEPIDSVISIIENKFPYELNMQRPLTEFLREMPETVRHWEMTQGLMNRANHLWAPMRAYWNSNLAIVSKLNS